MELLMDHLDEIRGEICTLEAGAKYLRDKLHSGDTDIMQETRHAMVALENAIEVFSDSLCMMEAVDAGVTHARTCPVGADGQAAVKVRRQAA